MRARAVAAIALSGALAFGLGGCALWSEPETNRPIDSSDGANVNVGSLELRNVIVLSDDGDLGNLIGTAVNTTASAIDFSVQWSVDGTYYQVDLTAAANGSTRFGTDGEQVTVQPLGEKPGSLLSAVIHTSDDQRPLQIPVLDATLPEYKPSMPTPTPTPTRTPTPSATETPAG